MSHPRSGYAPSQYGTGPGLVPAAPPPPQPPGRSRTGWWIALIVGLCLLGLLSGALVAALSRGSAPTSPVAPASVTPGVPTKPGSGSDESAAPEDDGLPHGSTVCSASQPAQGDFPRSASGNEQTSCDFAEAVRLAYLGQPRRDEVVTVHATSPVTGRDYLMTCSGDRPVTCVGGDTALVYLS